MKLSVESRDSSVAIVHHVDDEGVLATRGRLVFRRTARHETWQAVAAFPSGHRKDAMSVGRLASRLLRSEKCNVHPTREGKLLGIRRGVVYALASDGSETRVLGRIHGESVMPRAIAEDREVTLARVRNPLIIFLSNFLLYTSVPVNYIFRRQNLTLGQGMNV